VEGGALHGTHDGGEVSQKTSFEILHEVRGGHALPGERPDDGSHEGISQPHHPDVGQMGRSNARSTAAFVKSAVVEYKKTYRNMELPRQVALKPSRCLEDCLGGDIVGGPVVFLQGIATRYGSRS